MEHKDIFKPKTRTELAAEYGIDRKTLYLRLKELELPSHKLLMADCLKIIYKKYGYPKPKKE